VKLTTHLHLVPRSRSGTMPPVPQYAFMARCSAKAQGELYLQRSGSGLSPFVVTYCTFHELGPLACSNKELTSETMNPFRHCCATLWTGLSSYRKASTCAGDRTAENIRTPTYTHASSGIPTHDPSVLAVQDRTRLTRLATSGI
jgi:hypothetical protein